MRSRLALMLVVMTMLMSLAIPATSGLAMAQDGVATPDAANASEIVVDGQRYLFDREVPIDLAQLEQRADDAGTTIYVKTTDDPLGAVYVPADAGARRYLPEYLGAPETACPSEATPASSIEGNGAVYVPAGIEPDLTPDQLVQIGQTTDGRTLYAPSAEQPFTELFATGADDGLVHYVLVQENGVPATFPQQLTFAGQELQLTAGETPSLDGLQKVGCAGAFPALAASAEAAGPFSAIHVQVGDQLVTYRATETPQPTQAPATPAPTEPPIEPVATEPPATVAPTDAPPPTETPPPTAVPTEAPPTIAPTSTPEPTVAPTQVPPTTAPTQAPEPTAAPTESPPTAAPTEAAQPTEPPPTAAPTETPASRPTPTPQTLQPPAVVPTLPPEAPPPAAATSAAPTDCTGDPGPIGDDGLPERLPTSLQYGGTGYRFVESVPVGEIGDLTRIGCVGPFDAFSGDTEDVLYLTLSTVADTAYRYEATSAFSVSFEVTADPRVLTLQGEGDQPDTRYVAADPLERSIYSSVSLILYVPDAEATQPDRVLGYAIDHDVFGEYLPEGSADSAPEEVLAEAEAMGIHPTLTLGTSNQTYVLVSLWRPFGTTTNGWLTLHAPAGAETPEQLVGIDPRRLDLAVFNRAG